MRLIGQIPHASLIISVFKSNNKFILKFEVGPFEQTYKFLETDRLNDLEGIRQLVTEDCIAEVFKIFDTMNHHYKKLNSSL
mgnify:CR=1 FL=1|jgi:hypothetical protein